MLSYSLNSQLHTLSFNSKPTTFLLVILQQLTHITRVDAVLTNPFCDISVCPSNTKIPIDKPTKNVKAYKTTRKYHTNCGLLLSSSSSSSLLLLLSSYYYYKYYYYHSDHSISANPYHNCFGIYHTITQKPKKLFCFCQ